MAGRVPRGKGPGELDLDAVIPPADRRTIPTASCYAIAAADEALRQAQLVIKTEAQSHRAGMPLLLFKKGKFILCFRDFLPTI